MIYYTYAHCGLMWELCKKRGKLKKGIRADAKVFTLLIYS